MDSTYSETIQLECASWHWSYSMHDVQQFCKLVKSNEKFLPQKLIKNEHIDYEE